MEVVGLSEKGKKSSSNEDAYMCLPGSRLFVVADGVGGGPSGDFASRSVVETFYSRFTESSVSKDAILDSITFANDKVFQSLDEPSKKGMASTLVACWFEGALAWCFNVGDSRIYRIRNGEIERLTNDHVKRVEKSPNVFKEVVTNAIGIRSKIVTEVKNYPVSEGDFFLLMTDGVSDSLVDEVIRDIVITDGLSLVERARRLITESEKAGGVDDKTVILVKVGLGPNT